jgi:GntR family transcriptional regulator
MFLELNFKSGKPAYLQIVEQIKYALATGALHSGEQLPSIRLLAEQLRINRNTVAKAYGELEHEGVVQTEQGRGVFCCDAGSQLDRQARVKILSQALDGVIVQAYHLQVDGNDLAKLLKERLASFDARLSKAAQNDKENES